MNKTQIRHSLELATAAYRDIQPYSNTQMIDNAKSGVQCFLHFDHNVLRITFRGTDSPKEWLSNFRFAKKTIPYDNTNSDIRVHTGFLNTYKTKQVRDKILDTVNNSAHRIIVSGHSRGAALAVLCAVDIQYNFPNRDIEVILFGCPRVGNKAFAQSYNKRVNKTVRVENGNDIVTKIPFAFMGYRHVGAKLHIGSIRLPFIFRPHNHQPHEYYSEFLSKYM